MAAHLKLSRHHQLGQAGDCQWAPGRIAWPRCGKPREKNRLLLKNISHYFLISYDIGL
jgi:hypothetical protein